MCTSPLLSSKNHLINDISTQLKNEFLGIDHIIQQLIDAVKPWYLAPEIQSSPLVINLWGMTGVGKTSLVKRFLELALENQNIPNAYINLGDKRFAEDVVDQLEFLQKPEDERVVIIFDEFQHARTINEDSKDIERPFTKLIWPILDEGYFYYQPLRYEQPQVADWLNGLKICLQKGVVIQGGNVTENVEIFNQIMSEDDIYKYREIDHFEAPNKYSGDAMPSKNSLFHPPFLKNSQLKSIHHLCKEKYPFLTDLKAHISQLNGSEFLDFLQKIVLDLNNTKKIDLRKSLIFVIANLDEAYQMSDSMSAEADPDDLYKDSLEVNFHAIKSALKSYFRYEEIARLGNIHLIYPALSGEVFREFIQQQLEKFNENIYSTFKIKVNFDNSVYTMLYKEGVIPAQGLRPLKSTIRQMIEPAIVEFACTQELLENQEYFVQVEKEVLKIYDNQQLQFQKGLAMPISKSKYEVLDDETQSVIALHEAGHALVYLLCFKKFPKKISIQSSDWGVGGYVHVKNHNRLMSLTLLRRDTQVKLAGMVAEELIFGENNVTNGGIADLEHASRNLMIAAMKNGFAGRKAAFEHAQQGNGYALPVDEQIHSWVENELKLAKDNTLGLLKSHQIELGLLTDTLLKMKEMDTQALKQFIEKYELENKFILENENSGLYQKQLLNFINASKKELTLSLNS